MGLCEGLLGALDGGVHVLMSERKSKAGRKTKMYAVDLDKTAAAPNSFSIRLADT